MSASSTITLSARVNGGNALSGSLVDAGATDIEIPVTTIPAATTNQLFTFAFTRALVQIFMFLADQPCVIKTNSTGSPGDTLTLVANSPYYWSRSGYYAQPLAADITAIYVTTTLGTNFQARAITN